MSANLPLQGRAKIYTMAQVVISSLGFIISLGSAMLIFLMAVNGIISDPQSVQQYSAILVLAWTTLLVAFLLIPGAVISIQRLRGKEIPSIPQSWLKGLSIGGLILWIIALIISLIGSNWEWVGMINSIFVVPLVVLPLILLVSMGAKKLSLGSVHRTWGAVSFNFLVTMPVVLMAEIMIFVLIIIILGVWLSNNPLLMQQILAYSQQFSQAQLDPSAAEKLLTDLFKEPVVLKGSLFVIALLVPLLEEMLKPMALWFLAGKKLTPSQGFVGGMIAGACFALLETLGAIGAPTDISWFSLLIGRMGTGLLHITLSGMVGWGLASAFYNRNWKRLLGNYLLAVLIHGSWNLFALLSGIIPLLPFSNEMGSLPIFLSQIGPFVLVALAVVNVNILLGTNRKLRRKTSLSVETTQAF